ncbi:MAG: hypothetical protein OWS74_02875, partial [Firmicutes bacterium]|nr:hypothetical protein [Bacillota bacterium]
MAVKKSPGQDDYAVRYVPPSFRRWHFFSIFNVLLGVSTALFFLAWGGELTDAYGTLPTLWGMVFGTVFIGSVGFFFSWIGSATGLDSDLITRASGYGFMGSALASLIYSVNFIMFFAFEGSILVAALQLAVPAVSSDVWALAIGALFLILSLYGMRFLTWMMGITLPLYILAVGYVFGHVFTAAHPVPWMSYHPSPAPSTAAGPIFLQLAATVFALISMGTQEPERAILQGLDEMGLGGDAMIIHGSTVATNAIL